MNNRFLTGLREGRSLAITIESKDIPWSIPGSDEIVFMSIGIDLIKGKLG